MKAKEKLFSGFILLFLSVLVLGFSSCGSDDDDDDVPTTTKSIYRVEVAFGDEYSAYFKQVFVTPISYSNNVDVKDATGKILTTNNMSDSNYTFSTNNTFTTVDEVEQLNLTILISNVSVSKEIPDLKVHVKVYKGSSLVLDLDETATAKKAVSISKII